jgi:cytochrome c oxidase subunit 1
LTLTENAPAEAAQATTMRPPPAATTGLPESILTTSDHKRIGRYYIVMSLLFVLVSTVIGVILELELSAKGVKIVGNNWDRLFNLHSTAGALLFLPGLWIGLGLYLVPLQIGARRVAFPRMAAMAFWSYVVGGGMLLFSYAVAKPAGAGLASSAPIPVIAHGSRVTDLWSVSLIVITLSVLAASVNLFVTVLKLRVPGMTMPRMPAFSWSILAVSAATLLSAPAFVAGMLIAYMDQHFGGSALAATQGNANFVWEKLVWLYGRPDVYLVVVPCLGAMTDIVATHARRPLLQSLVAKGVIFAAAALSFSIWMAGVEATTAVLIPTPTIASLAVGLPVGLCALLWLGTIRPNDLRFHVSLLYVVGFLLFLVAAVAAGAVAATKHLHGGVAGSEWTVGQVHAVLFAAPTMALMGAAYHWSPKIWGRALNQAVGALQWLLLVGGFGLTSLAAWLAGFDGAPWHVADYTQARATHYFNYAKLGSAGGVLVVLGLLLFAANVTMSFRGAQKEGPLTGADANPYEAGTLEWAAASPPARDNFDVVPDVRSETPLADLEASR